MDTFILTYRQEMSTSLMNQLNAQCRESTERLVFIATCIELVIKGMVCVITLMAVVQKCATQTHGTVHKHRMYTIIEHKGY